MAESWRAIVAVNKTHTWKRSDLIKRKNQRKNFSVRSSTYMLEFQAH